MSNAHRKVSIGSALLFAAIFRHGKKEAKLSIDGLIHDGERSDELSSFNDHSRRWELIDAQPTED